MANTGRETSTHSKAPTTTCMPRSPIVKDTVRICFLFWSIKFSIPTVRSAKGMKFVLQSLCQNTCPWICTRGTPQVVPVSTTPIVRNVPAARTLDVSVHSSSTINVLDVGSRIPNVDIVSF